MVLGITTRTSLLIVVASNTKRTKTLRPGYCLARAEGLTSSESTVSVTRAVEEKVETASTSIRYWVIFEPPLSDGTSICTWAFPVTMCIAGSHDMRDYPLCGYVIMMPRLPLDAHGE